MTRLPELDISKETAARSEFIEQFYPWFPPTYREMMPLTTDGLLLLEEGDRIERLMNADMEFLKAEKSSPWLKFGPPCKTVDWSRLSAGMKRGLEKTVERPVGLPHALRPLLRDGKVVPGMCGDGRAFSEIPEVVAEMELAHQRAEYVAWVKTIRTRALFVQAEKEFLPIYNAHADGKTEKRTGREVLPGPYRRAAKIPTDPEFQAAKEKLDAAEKQLDDATAEFESLRSNAEEGLKIVREKMSNEAIEKELEAARRGE